MNDTLIINGITYKAVKEEKKPERLEGWIDKYQFDKYRSAEVTEIKHGLDNTRMVELRSGEIIVSEDDVRVAFEKSKHSNMFLYKFIEALGFKKDGAV